MPTCEGDYFLGWFTDVTGGTKVTGETNVTLNADQTLFARWTTTGYTGAVGSDMVLYVAGREVTTENMNDIMGDGPASVQFDPGTNKLYLNNATIAGAYSTSYISAAINSSESITIVNTGTSTVTNTYNGAANVTNVFGIYALSTLVIEGTGTLTVTSGTGGTSYNCGIRSGLSGSYFTINGPTVNVFGGTAGSGGKSYGVCVGTINLTYTVRLLKGTLETHRTPK